MMRKITVVIMIINLMGCGSIKGVTEVDKILVYNKFILNGTPANVSSAFNNPTLYKETVDTQPNELHLIKKDFEVALSTAEVKNYIPQKMGGITYAGEFYTGNTKHFFLYFQSVKLVIDFTEKKRYILKDTLNFVRLK